MEKKRKAVTAYLIKNSKSPVIINVKGQFEKYSGLEQDFQNEGETYFVFVKRKRRKEKG